MSQSESSGYLRRLGLFDATMAVVGGIIGAGIFVSPAIVAERVGTSSGILLVWVLGSAIAMAGALCFGELGASNPKVGGGYAYLRDAFGPLPAFLYGWTLLLVIHTGGIAAVSMVFARYAIALLRLSSELTLPLAVGAIVSLSVINYLGTKPGATTQNIFTLLKLAALAVLIVAGLIQFGRVDPVAPPSAVTTPGPGLTWSALSAALVPVLFAYSGWQSTNFIAGEIRRPEHNLPRALLMGVSMVVTTYLLVNVVYLNILGVEGLAGSQAPATEAMLRLMGKVGASLISAGIVVSTFGVLSLVILATPRVYQAMGEDGVFFGWASRLHPRYRTPANAIWLQAGWAVVLTCSGTYGQLMDYVVFGDWIFFAAIASTLFVYRRRGSRGGDSSTFRVPAYPWVPGAFVLASTYVVLGSVAWNPGNAVLGASLILTGIPVYYWSRR